MGAMARRSVTHYKCAELMALQVDAKREVNIKE